jgi:hypothetical protein
MYCPECGKAGAKEKCGECGWKAPNPAGEGRKSPIGNDDPLLPHQCEFKTGAWRCQHVRYATKKSGLVFCEVHAEALRQDVSSLPATLRVLLDIRESTQKYRAPGTLARRGLDGEWEIGWIPGPGQTAVDMPMGKPARFIPFHWLPLEECWKQLTGLDTLPEAAPAEPSGLKAWGGGGHE